MIRDYIIHDRGNSLYLGDSFANLPSPVNETQSIKQLFKPVDNEDEIKAKKRDKKEKDDNINIKIEGKEDNEESDAEKTVV